MLKTNKVMRQVLLSIFVPLCILACNPLDFAIGSRRKSETVAGARNSSPGFGKDSSHAPLPDTLVYLSAVSVPSGYDWVRDSCFGAIKAKLLLFRNGEAIVNVDAGLGTTIPIQAESHHLIEGNLYTEYCGEGKTHICKNGEPLLTWNGEEVLCGLLPLDGDVYTLATDRSSGNTVLRKNGSSLLNLPAGNVFGGFDNPCYGRTGALYRSGKDIYFCAMKNKDIYFVCNGEINIESPPDNYHKMLDCRFIDGQLRMLYMYQRNAYYCDEQDSRRVSGVGIWTDGALLPSDGDGIFALGGYDGYLQMVRTSNSTTFGIYDFDFYSAYPDDIKICPPPDLPEDCLLMHYGCAQNYRGSLYMGVSKMGGKPYLSAPNGDSALDINGYISGVEVVSNRSNL